MTVLKNPVFAICCLLFWANQLLEKKWGIFIPLVHEYLDDLLAMPVVLGISLQAFRWIHPLKDRFVFTKTQVVVGWLYFSLLFEVILPWKSEQYIADIWDVVCYGIGSILFHFSVNNVKQS